MKRKSLSDADCPVARTLDVIGDWWSLLIVRDALDGLTRFSDFHASLGIAKNILSDRLQLLVEHQILEITSASDGSAYHDYVLTPKGKDLFTVIVSLRQWGETYSYRLGERHSALVDKKLKQPLRKIEVLSTDGRLIGANDTMVLKVKPTLRSTEPI